MSPLAAQCLRLRFHNIFFKFCFSFVLIAFGINAASAHTPKLAFKEIAQTADLIFVGTVAREENRANDNGSMAVTSVFFNDITLIHATNRSLQRGESEVRLTYAGGNASGMTITVGHPPQFEVGKRYLIFMHDDGKTYLNPIVGGTGQGLFQITKDRATGVEYVLNAVGKPITGVSAEEVSTGARRIAEIRSGAIVSLADDNALPDLFNTEAATASSPNDAASSLDRERVRNATARPLRLRGFINSILNTALKAPLGERKLKLEGRGKFYQGENGNVEAFDFPEQDFAASADTAEPINAPLDELTGGTVGYCGSQTLPINFEMVPTTFWNYAVDESLMADWNRYMDLYRILQSDGGYGNNTRNEMGGWASDADISRIYGFNPAFSWGGALAVTVTFANANCGRILQTDIFFNPAYSFSDNETLTIGNSSVYNYRVTQAHELGHTWGAQRGTYTETYDYDVPTVMQGIASQIVENGRGIHSTDAYMIRRNYQSVTPIRSVADVGVESYYNSNGQKISTTNALTYTAGNSITLNNVQVENTGNAAVSDMRLRFYLSTDRNITTSDYQLGTDAYWYWTSFAAEQYNVGTYNTTIPANIPTGTYYVGAIISANGFGGDDYGFNNAVSFFRQITVNALPPPCTYSLSSTSAPWNNFGGTSTFNVTTGSTCAFSVSSSDGTWLTHNGGGTGSRSVTYNVAANTSASSRTATLTIANSATGANPVTFTVTQSGAPAVCTTTPISFGATLSGNLTMSDCRATNRSGSYAEKYTFIGTAGQRIAIEMNSTAIADTYLYLIAPNGTLETYDDDGGAGALSRIPAETGFYTLLQTGTYTIEATTYGSDVTGAYTLTLTREIPPTIITAIADTYVQGADAFRATNYGNATEMQIKRTLNPGAGRGRRGFLKFDTSAHTGAITNARLRVFGRLSEAALSNIEMMVQKVTDTTWSETGMTWNNQPAVASPTALSQIMVLNSTAQWYEFDLTAFLQQERAAGRSVVSLRLINLQPTGTSGTSFTSIATKEAGTSTAPQLVITP
jgi:hypothetical protein